MQDLRRGLERGPEARWRALLEAMMAIGKPTPRDIISLTRDLNELIEAIDRRLPQIERAGELSIARDAALLRDRAIARLAALAPAD
jgi:hypothetical protein